MADLKLGTTIGGSPVWNQGNFPLFPAGDSVLYKSYKIYTEKDKPQAVDNDFVSKANGGTYLNTVKFDNSDSQPKGVQIAGYYPGIILQTKASAGGADSYAFYTYANNTGDWIFRAGPTAGTLATAYRWVDKTRVFEVTGSIKLTAGSTNAIYDSTGQQVYSPQNKPTPAAIGAVALDAVVDFGTY